MSRHDRGKIFTSKFSKNLTSFLERKNYSHHFILTDDNTHAHCLPTLLREAEQLAISTRIKIYDGEKHKNLQAVEYVWKRLTEEHADRNAVLINLGGGMVCDLGGFAAATYKRGIDFIHIPTSLLAQVDAAVGGKQGIDFMGYKNQVGVFANPAAIFINDKFLSTLPAQQLASGFAEVMKHALIAGGKLWKDIEEIDDLNKVDWSEIIDESVSVKVAVVEKDLFEKDLRKILNFGHTIGHAIESLLIKRDAETLHGFCVAAGMIGELHLSTICCGLTEKKRDQAVASILKHFPSLNISEDDFVELISLMQQDKKNAEGKIKMVLLEKPGQPVIDIEVDEALISQALEFILNSYKKNEA